MKKLILGSIIALALLFGTTQNANAIPGSTGIMQYGECWDGEQAVYVFVYAAPDSFYWAYLGNMPC